MRNVSLALEGNTLYVIDGCNPPEPLYLYRVGAPQQSAVCPPDSVLIARDTLCEICGFLQNTYQGEADRSAYDAERYRLWAYVNGLLQLTDPAPRYYGDHDEMNPMDLRS